MLEAIPTLWSAKELKPKVLTPVAILRAQASQLSPMTQGILRAEVTALHGEEQDILGLDIIAPALDNYRYRMLSVEYTKNMYYPATVSANGLTVTETTKYPYILGGDRTTVIEVEEKVAYSDEELITILGEALQAPENVAMLQSLIARSNEVTNPTTEIEDVDIDEIQAEEQSTENES